MKRLLVAAALACSCGGAAELMLEGTGQGAAALGGTMTGPPPPELTVLEMPELVVEVRGAAEEVEARMAPMVEDRFFYVMPVSLTEQPVLPPPPCPVCR